MDGNKKIKWIVFSGVITLAITACKIQPSAYPGLYVDNLTSINDTSARGEAPLNMLEDTSLAALSDTSTINERELPLILHPEKETLKISSDSIYQHEVKKLLKAINDSIQVVRRQIIDFQNQHLLKADTSYTGKSIHTVTSLDNMYPENDFKKLIQAKNDTIASLRSQLTEIKKSAGLEADTVYINNEIKQQRDSLQIGFETSQLWHSKNDTIAFLRKLVLELQNNGSKKTDTIYVFKEREKSPVTESQQTDYVSLQLIKAKDEQIEMLQNQLNALQSAVARTSQQTQITREPVLAEPSDKQQAESMTRQLIKAKNDTILLLRNKLQNLQLQPQERDTVYIEKEPKELQAGKELVARQEAAELQALQDTISLLKTRVLSLEEQILPNMDADVHTGQDEKDPLYTLATDTTLLIAFYELGETKPLEEESILQQIEELCSNKNVDRITLSGYTDSSGNEEINKEITDRRLNYLSEMIIPWIEKEKIFCQNFGDTFASDMILINERKIEIRIFTKEEVKRQIDEMDDKIGVLEAKAE